LKGKLLVPQCQQSSQSGQTASQAYLATPDHSEAVSEIERLRLENARLKKQLTQAQRSSALGELVGTTTHEFNNILMMILNYAKLGIRNPDKTARDKAFEKILKAGQRASRITNSVLGMARNRTDEFAPTKLDSLVDETMVLLEKELQKYQISTEVQVEDGLPMVPAIGNQIQQILLNLVVNARQAMPDGGQLIIRLQKDNRANTVDLSIRDFGTGIPQDQLRRIFDPYFTTKAGPDESGKGGTGLGLHACRNIIEAHGGKIRVESTVGKGTCFTLKLPITRPCAKTGTRHAAEAAPSSIAG
jgi:signal transduction histidine kinase